MRVRIAFCRLFVAGRSTGLIPLHDNQTDGEPPHGVQFPQVLPESTPWEWEPLRPSLPTLAASLFYAMRAGAGSFVGFAPRKQLAYVMRVAWFAAPWTNYWDYPAADAEHDSEQQQQQQQAADGNARAAHRPLSLARHFGGALLRRLSGGSHGDGRYRQHIEHEGRGSIDIAASHGGSA